MKKIVIDPGHGGRDPGATSGGLAEKDFNLDICLRLAEKMAVYQAEILLTRVDDTYVSLKERTDRANSFQADFFLSIHCNAGGGKGFESYVHPDATGASRAAREILHREVAGFLKAAGTADRGMKLADFFVLRMTGMPSTLLEALFIDHPGDVKLLREQSFLDSLAEAVSRGLAGALELPGAWQKKTPARVPADTHPEQARRFLAGKNPAAPDYVDIYASMEARYGIRWDAVLAQSMKETAFWRFGGLVKPDQNNFSGLGAFGSNPGARFRTPEEGIEAQFQHWHVYYEGSDLPPGAAVLDPRREAVLSSGMAGTLEYVEDLGGHWAPSPDYGASIVRDYLDPMKSIPLPEPPPATWDPQGEIDKLKKSGLIVSDHSPGDPVTWGEFSTVMNKLLAAYPRL